MSLVSPAAPAVLAVHARRHALLAVLCSIVATACTKDVTPITEPPIDIGQIAITNGNVTVEKGFHLTMAATVRNKQGVTLTNIPLAWRSLAENVATIDINGRLTAIDTGTTTIVASALNVISAPVAIRVVHVGADKIDAYLFTPPTAVNPGATADSIHVLVSDALGKPLTVPVRVAFAVTRGGGTISPAIATTDRNGVAAAEWKLGPTADLNTATATLLGEEDHPLTSVSSSVATFALRTYAALTAVEGDGQTGVVLSGLPTPPSVRLVDSLGKPRLGVPVTFAVTGGGKVAAQVVSTGADGTASPGVWTLGETPGVQMLVAKVELATVTLTATATGTPVFYTPTEIVAGGFGTCALEVDGSASCWGLEPAVGDSSAVNKYVPTPTSGGIKFINIATGPTNPSHFCGIAVDQFLYCWGPNSFPDTTTGTKLTTAPVPSKVSSSLAWTSVAPGQAHTCAIAADQLAYCWGDNSQGQLGDRSTKIRLAPGVVSGGFKFAQVSSGAAHTCGLSLEGSIFCWGINGNGQLGDGTTASKTSPTAVSGVLTFKSLSAGASFTCGLTAVGRVYCWGNLGTGSTAVLSPRTYPTAPDFTSITAGGFHACGLTADGTAYCWGNNTGGQVGDSSVVERPNPTLVSTPLKFKTLSAGLGHTCGLTTDGAAACWGLNNVGELAADSTIAARLTPKLIVKSVTP